MVISYHILRACVQDQVREAMKDTRITTENNSDADERFEKQLVIKSYTIVADHKQFSSGLSGLGLSLVVTIYCNKKTRTFSFPLLLDPVDEENGKSQEKTAETIMNCCNKMFHDTTKEYSFNDKIFV